MGARSFDPTRLDVAVLAAEGATLEGRLAAADLPRWHAMQSPPAGVALEPVHWQVRGELRRAIGGPQMWLHLHADAVAWPTCQRCLQPFSEALVVDRALHFVDDEAQAEALDAESEDDVLALTPALDLPALLEDELVLAWPIVPRHTQCSAPQHRAGEAASAEPGPFASLAALKPRPSGH
ncbi:MAG TPA: DUF177 domain-containing protein [Burkholderiaceae bacterium]|nr:DUF177 domain-containing protein [Burkholderiaceae bacterium]